MGSQAAAARGTSCSYNARQFWLINSTANSSRPGSGSKPFMSTFKSSRETSEILEVWISTNCWLLMVLIFPRSLSLNFGSTVEGKVISNVMYFLHCATNWSHDQNEPKSNLILHVFQILRSNHTSMCFLFRPNSTIQMSSSFNN